MNTNLERALFSSIDFDRFWAIVDELEKAPEPKLQQYNPFQMLRMRYYTTGDKAHTFKELGLFFGIKPEYARHVVNGALRTLRHPRWSRRYRI